MSFLCMTTAQIVGFLILALIAGGFIFLCGVLRNKIKQEKFIQSTKSEDKENEDSSKVEGVSLLAKRKYIVSDLNKIKPMIYTLIDADESIIVINDKEAVYNSGDSIEFKDGDTVSAKQGTVTLSCEEV